MPSSVTATQVVAATEGEDGKETRNDPVGVDTKPAAKDSPVRKQDTSAAEEEQPLTKSPHPQHGNEDVEKTVSEPKLSLFDSGFAPPNSGLHPSLTEPKSRSTVTEIVDPTNSKYPYQLNWNPRGYSPREGYPPYPSPNSVGLDGGKPPYYHHCPSYPAFFPPHVYHPNMPPHGGGSGRSPYPTSPYSYYPPPVCYPPHPSAAPPFPSPYPTVHPQSPKGQKSPLRSTAMDINKTFASGENKESNDSSKDGTQNGSTLSAFSKPEGNSGRAFEKPRAAPTLNEIQERRLRKNQQSRSRAAKKRQKIEEIAEMVPELRTSEEQAMLDADRQRRQSKNDRSRLRAAEKKKEAERILAKDPADRTNTEITFLETYEKAKNRKNEGDRLRRTRLKELGLTKVSPAHKPGVSARGPLPPHLASPQSGSFDGYPYPMPMYHSPPPYAPPGYGYSPYGYTMQGMGAPPPPPPPGDLYLGNTEPQKMMDLPSHNVTEIISESASVEPVKPDDEVAVEASV